MSIPFHNLGYGDQTQVASEWNKKQGGPFRQAENDMARKTLIDDLRGNLAELGIILPASIRLAGPGLMVLAAAVASAAAVKRMQDAEREPTNSELNELAGVQMSRKLQRLEQRFEITPDERAQEIINGLNRKGRRLNEMHRRPGEKPEVKPAQFSAHSGEIEIFAAHREVNIGTHEQLAPRIDVSEARADEIVGRAQHNRRR